MFKWYPRLVVRGRFRLISIMTGLFRRQDGLIIVFSNFYAFICGLINCFSNFCRDVCIFFSMEDIFYGLASSNRIFDERLFNLFYERSLLRLMSVIGRFTLVFGNC